MCVVSAAGSRRRVNSSKNKSGRAAKGRGGRATLGKAVKGVHAPAHRVTKKKSDLAGAVRALNCEQMKGTVKKTEISR